METPKARTFILLFIFLAFTITSVPFLVAAQDENGTETTLTDDLEASQIETEKVNLAFSWLSSQVKTGWPDSTEENAFLLLALSYDDYLAGTGRTALFGRSKNNECWSETISGKCEIKPTALALLALNKIGEKTKKVEDWLLSRRGKFTAGNLIWHIQLDADKETNCTISYDGGEYKIHLDEKPNQKATIIKEPSSSELKCLSSSMDGYWLRINTPVASPVVCLQKTYAISCTGDAEVKMSMPYQKEKQLFIPGETFNVPVETGVKAECLMDDGSTTCNYEGTLWAAYALSKKRRNINTLLPYLVSQADELENQNYLPSSLIYLIMPDKEEYAENLINSQFYNKMGFWRTVKYGKYYSSALATLALSEYFAADDTITKVKEYLLDHQDINGYWDDGNKVKDTAFILYSLWYGKGEIVPFVNETINRCEEENYTCLTSCLDNQEEVSYYSSSCGTGYKCCKEKETAPECSTVEDCAKPECDGKWVGECKCEYLKEKSCSDGCDNDVNGYTDSEDPSCQVGECERENYVCCHECKAEYEHFSEFDDSCSGNVCCKECLIIDTEICDNGIDDNGNGFIDCKDSACANDESCKKSLLWLWILIIVVVLGGGVGAYFYFSKKGVDFPALLKRVIGKKGEEFKKYKFNPVPAKRLASLEEEEVVRGPPARPQGRQGRQQRLIKRTATTQKSETEEELEKTLKKLEEIGEEKEKLEESE